MKETLGITAILIIVFFLGILTGGPRGYRQGFEDGYEHKQPPPPYSIEIGWNTQCYIKGEAVSDRELQRAVGFTEDSPAGYRPDGVIGKNTIEAVLFQNSLDERFWEKSRK